MYLTKKQKFILVSVFIILLGLIGVCIYLHWARPPSTVKQMTQTEFKKYFHIGQEPERGYGHSIRN